MPKTIIPDNEVAHLAHVPATNPNRAWLAWLFAQQKAALAARQEMVWATIDPRAFYGMPTRWTDRLEEEYLRLARTLPRFKPVA